MQGAQNAEIRLQPAGWRKRTAKDARKRQVMRFSHFPVPDGARSQRCGVYTSVFALP